MATLPLACFAPADDAAWARRRMLRKRMRLVATAAVILIATVIAAVVFAYVEVGAFAAVGLLVIGCLLVFEAVRQADQRFIAPLQARCQDDYNRQIDAVLGPLLEPKPRRAAEPAHRVDA